MGAGTARSAGRSVHGQVAAGDVPGRRVRERMVAGGGVRAGEPVTDVGQFCYPSPPPIAASEVRRPPPESFEKSPTFAKIVPARSAAVGEAEAAVPTARSSEVVGPSEVVGSSDMVADLTSPP